MYACVISSVFNEVKGPDDMSHVTHMKTLKGRSPEIHEKERLRVLGISRYKFKLRFLVNLNLYRGNKFEDTDSRGGLKRRGRETLKRETLRDAKEKTLRDEKERDLKRDLRDEEERR